MIRAIFFIVVFAIFLVFIALNLNNKSDVSFGFVSFKDVPIFLSTLFSFAVGMMFTLPLILYGKKRKKTPATQESAAQGAAPHDGKKKKRWAFGKKKSRDDAAPAPATIAEARIIKTSKAEMITRPENLFAMFALVCLFALFVLLVFFMNNLLHKF